MTYFKGKDRKMKYPMINKQPRREVNIPQLSGGLNLRDSLTGVRDNQMTDCVNMWYKNGTLRTRPPLRRSNAFKAAMYKINKTKVFAEITNGERVLVSTASIQPGGILYIEFCWQGKNDALGIDAGFIRGNETEEYTANDDVYYFVVEKDGVLYCYTEKGKIFKCEFKTGSTKWNFVDLSESYIPTVIIHGKSLNFGQSYTGTQFEGFNILCNSYKMIFSTLNKEDRKTTSATGEVEYPMAYPIVYKDALDINKGYTIKVKHTTIDGITAEHTVVCSVDTVTENCCFEKVEKEPEDNLYMFVRTNAGKQTIGFCSRKDTAAFQTITEDEFVEDNLEISVIIPTDVEKNEIRKVFGMTQSIWFGGSADGINGGSRLFLCGNTNESEKSLVIWSSLNNPLYFSENNYAYVGNKAEPVTAFGKQGENLIIFKPNETYYSYYAQNSDINANDLINQTVVDYEANSVYFPMITLHSTIGCDCPDTVQLCRNRLVWLNSDGKVYTLVSANQYSEMTIYPVSDMIERRIKATHSVEQLKTATSHDFEGHYVLMIECDAYVMDYNSYGYTHVYGYTKTEDANCLIPWYYWRFNIESKNVKFYGFKDFIFSFYRINDSDVLTFCVLCSSGINENFYDEKIVSSLQTKMFDFSSAGYLKNIDRVSVGFGNNGGEPISVSFVTDKGIESDVVSLNGAQTDERQAAFVRVKNFHPSARAVRTFGVKIECEGPLVIDGLALQYRLLGGVK